MNPNPAYDFGEMGFFDDNGALAGDNGTVLFANHSGSGFDADIDDGLSDDEGLGMPWGPVIDSGIPGDAAGMGQTMTPAQQLAAQRQQLEAQRIAAADAASARNTALAQGIFSNITSAATAIAPAALNRRGALPPADLQQQDTQAGGGSSVLPWVVGGLVVFGLGFFALRSRSKS